MNRTGRLRLALILSILGLALGCEVRVPAKKPAAAPPPAKVPTLRVGSLGTPSSLIDPSSLPSGPTDKLPFDLPLGKGYGIEGSWAGPSQVRGTYQFERNGDFTIRKSDQTDVDPKEIRDVLERWIDSSGVQRTQSSGELSFERTIGYGTAQTTGTIRLSIRPETPAREVSFRLEVREQPRQTR